MPPRHALQFYELFFFASALPLFMFCPIRKGAQDEACFVSFLVFLDFIPPFFFFLEPVLVDIPAADSLGTFLVRLLLPPPKAGLLYSAL